MITAIIAFTVAAAVVNSVPFNGAAAEVARSHRRNGPATVVRIHHPTYLS